MFQNSQVCCGRLLVLADFSPTMLRAVYTKQLVGEGQDHRVFRFKEQFSWRRAGPPCQNIQQFRFKEQFLGHLLGSLGGFEDFIVGIPKLRSLKCYFILCTKNIAVYQLIPQYLISWRHDYQVYFRTMRSKMWNTDRRASAFVSFRLK